MRFPLVGLLAIMTALALSLGASEVIYSRLLLPESANKAAIYLQIFPAVFLYLSIFFAATYCLVRQRKESKRRKDRNDSTPSR